MTPILLDEGLPRRAAANLRSLGWNARQVFDVGLGGATDSDIVAFARANELAVVTLDSDFGTLLARSGARRPSILFLRMQGLDTPATVHVITTLPAEAITALDAGSIVVHNGTTIRIRPLPLT